MDTATRNARADRIRRLWMRATGNFRKARLAYAVASMTKELATRGSDDYRQACIQARAALHSMNHWNRRSAALARAEIATVLGDAAHA